MKFRKIFFLVHFRTPSVWRNLVGMDSMGGVSPIPRASGVPNMMPTASSTYWRLAARILGLFGLVHPMGFWQDFGRFEIRTHQGGGCKDFESSVFGVFLLKNEVFADDFYREIGGISKNCQAICSAKEEFCQPGHANLAKHVFVPILQVSGVDSPFCFREFSISKHLMDEMSWFRIATSLCWNDTLDLLPTPSVEQLLSCVDFDFSWLLPRCPPETPRCLKSKTWIDQHHLTPDAIGSQSFHLFFRWERTFPSNFAWRTPVWRWPGTIERCRVPSPKCRWGVWVAVFWVKIYSPLEYSHPSQIILGKGLWKVESWMKRTVSKKGKIYF